MDNKKLNKIKRIKSIFDNEKIYYTEFANGHLKIDKVNFWCTSEKWYDEENRLSGVGLNSFLKYVREHNII